MHTPPRDQVEAALAEVIQDALMRGESVQIDGLGTFSTRHQSSKLIRTDDGALKMSPPEREVVFTPES